MAWLGRSLASRIFIAIAVLGALVTAADIATPSVFAQSSFNGDADCSNSLTGNDALVIVESTVGNRGAELACPLSTPRTSVNMALADFNDDGDVTLIDALLLAKCCGQAAGSRFETLPPTSPLPSGESCAALIRPTAETIPENAAWNARRGATVVGTTYLSDRIAAQVFEARIDGDFVGTTDEIIQWAACKWGIDEDHVRAQALVESSWFAGKLGDCGNITPPATNSCASVGLLQVRGAEVDAVHPGTMPWAWDSTAFNLDYALAVHRACFEGLEVWLAGQSPNGVVYRPGDLIGCSGRWFSGDWYSNEAIAYVTELGDAINRRRWRADATGCVNWQSNSFCR